MQEQLSIPRVPPSGVRFVERTFAKVGVFVIEPRGHCTFAPLGYRGEEVFSGTWEASPTAIAREVGRTLRMSLEVQELVETDDCAWIVLRHSGRYSQRIAR